LGNISFTPNGHAGRTQHKQKGYKKDEI